MNRPMKRNVTLLAASLVLFLVTPADAWVTSQMGRTNEPCVNYAWTKTVSDIEPDERTVVAFDNSDGSEWATDAPSTDQWDDPVTGFVTLGNPTERPIAVRVSLILTQRNDDCLIDGSCSAPAFFSGIVQPHDERQINFAFDPADLAATTQETFEIVVTTHVPGLKCVNATYWSVEHSNGD